MLLLVVCTLDSSQCTAHWLSSMCSTDHSQLGNIHYIRRIGRHTARTAHSLPLEHSLGWYCHCYYCRHCFHFQQRTFHQIMCSPDNSLCIARSLGSKCSKGWTQHSSIHSLDSNDRHTCNTARCYLRLRNWECFHPGSILLLLRLLLLLHFLGT